MKKLIITGLFATLANCALAATHTVDGIEWTYTVSNGEASLGGGSWDAPAISKTTTGAIIIPSTLDGLPVTSIGWSAFSNCSELTSVTMPDSVTSIGDSAFFDCDGLTSVTIPDSVTSIGSSAFRDCDGLTSFVVSEMNPSYCSRNGLLLSKDEKTLVYGVNGNVTIPDSVTSIGNYAFCDCSGLTSVTIGNGVTSIGNYAFAGCSGLTSVTIPDSVTSIGDEAFYDCISLTSVTIGNGVTSIGDEAFCRCSGLTSVTIGNGVTSIGESAFYCCDGLTSVNVTDLSAWCEISFEGFDANPLCHAHSLYLNGNLVANLVIPEGVTSIGDYAFCVCDGLTSVTIPDSVTSIGSSAFRDCDGLTSVTIPDSVTSIGDSAFCDCDGLTSVTIPDSVKSIGDYAFGYCSGLTSVAIPDSVTSIGSSAFYCCSGLTSVTIPDSVKSIGDYAFGYCSGLTSVTIPDSVTSIGSWTFAGCSGLTSVTIGNGVTSIGGVAFRGCSGLTSVTIGNGVTSIWSDAFEGCSDSLFDTMTVPGVKLVDGWVVGYIDSCSGDLDLTGVRGIADSAFDGCSGLTSVTIPDSVTSIGYSAFDGCSGLTSVTIPDSVTSIGYSAFRYCSGLTSVTIPDSVTSIGDSAFNGCEGLTSVTFRGDEPNIEDDSYVFDGVPADCMVYVPRSAKFNVDANGQWCGMKVEYYDLEEEPVEPEPVDPDPVNPDPVQPDPVTPDPVTPDPVNPQPGPAKPSYEVIEAEDIVAAYEVPKAVVLKGVIYGGDEVVGIIELKLGKVNAKKQSGKVSGSVTTLDGKKHTIKSANITGIDGKSSESVSLDVKDMGTMNIRIGGAEFAGSMGAYHVQSGEVGGAWSGSGATVAVEADNVSMFAGSVLVGLLPVAEQAKVTGGKWKFDKATGVKWAKPKKGAARPELYDEASGKGLIVNEAGGKTNRSAMKLTYTPKKGTFKGAFKVYALEGEGKATKLKKYNVGVSGLVVGGVGHGTATCKKPAAKWSVTVK